MGTYPVNKIYIDEFGSDWLNDLYIDVVGKGIGYLHIIGTPNPSTYTKIGDTLIITQDAKDYAPAYVNTDCIILDYDPETDYTQVELYDGKRTWMPLDYLMEADDFYTFKKKSSKCECGAHKTYGKINTQYMHSDWCDLYKEKI